MLLAMLLGTTQPNLRQLAKARGFTLSEVAAHIERSPSFMSLLNKGLVPEDPAIVRKIAAFLHCRPRMVETAIIAGRTR